MHIAKQNHPIKLRAPVITPATQSRDGGKTKKSELHFREDSHCQTKHHCVIQDTSNAMQLPSSLDSTVNRESIRLANKRSLPGSNPGGGNECFNSRYHHARKIIK